MECLLCADASGGSSCYTKKLCPHVQVACGIVHWLSQQAKGDEGHSARISVMEGLGTLGSTKAHIVDA